jgi:hypothetical protein
MSVPVSVIKLPPRHAAMLIAAEQACQSKKIIPPSGHGQRLDYFLTFVHFPRKTNTTLGFIKNMTHESEPL